MRLIKRDTCLIFVFLAKTTFWKAKIINNTNRTLNITKLPVLCCFRMQNVDYITYVLIIRNYLRNLFCQPYTNFHTKQTLNNYVSFIKRLKTESVYATFKIVVCVKTSCYVTLINRNVNQQTHYKPCFNIRHMVDLSVESCETYSSLY